MIRPDLSEAPRPFSLRHEVDRRASLLYVDWKLNNYCNYRCSYCRPQFHEGTLKGPPVSQIFRIVDQLVAGRPDRSWKHFHFTGGEPTAYQALPELLKKLKQSNFTTSVITNGSKSVAWWTEQCDYLNEIFFTFHIEMTQMRHLTKVLATVSETAALVHVNVTMLPKLFDECLAAANLFAAQFGCVSVSLKPLIQPDRRMYEYSPAQKNILQTWFKPSDGRRFKQRAKSQMLLDFDNGSAELLPSSRLISRGWNRFRGWQCNVGVETLSISADGRIFRGNCRVGGQIGTLATGIEIMPRDPVICNRDSCFCAGDLCTEKTRLD